MKNPFQENKFEIVYNLVNAGLAGLLVLVGQLVNGGISPNGLLAALGTAFLVCLIQFQDYWNTQKKEYSCRRNKKGCSKKLFCFI